VVEMANIVRRIILMSSTIVFGGVLGVCGVDLVVGNTTDLKIFPKILHVCSKNQQFFA
jgi:hypothetical protein